jgi:hypothetical protein
MLLQKKFISEKFFKKISKIFLISLISFYSLSLLLGSGFFSDDAYQSQIHGTLIERNYSLARHTYQEIVGWILQGRIFPLTNLSFTIFYFLYDNLYIYKLLNITIIILCLIFFYKNLNLLFNDSNTAFITTILVIGSMQLRLWHDPVQGFHILLPLVMLFFLLSIYYFQKFIIKNVKSYLNYSFIYFVIMILHYEISYVLIFVYPIVFYNYHNSYKNFIKIFKKFLIFSSTIFALTFLIRIFIFFKKKAIYSTLSFGSPLETFNAFFIQFSSSVPLIYLIRIKEKLIKNFIQPLDILFLTLIFFVIYFSLKKINFKKIKANIIILFLISIILSAGPALIISFTPHRNELLDIGYGYGYLPVFIQYFGFSLLIICIFIFILKKIKINFFSNFFLICLSIGISIIFYLNLLTNRFVVHEANKIYKHPRILLESALKKGMFDLIEDNAVIVRKMRFAHDWLWFHATYTKKVFDLCEPKDLFISDRHCLSKKYYLEEYFTNKSSLNNKVINLKDKNIYTYSYNFDKNGKDIGQVFLAKIESIDFKNYKEINKIEVKEFFVYQQKLDRIYRLYFPESLDFKKIMEDDNSDPVAYLLHTEFNKYKYK